MFRTILKDVREFLANPRSAALMLVWPCIMLWAIAPLPNSDGSFRIYVDSAGPQYRNYSSVLAARLDDLPDVNVIHIDKRPDNVWAFIDENKLDAAIVWHDAIALSEAPPPTLSAGGTWYAYVQPRSQFVARKLDYALQYAHLSALLQEENSTEDPRYDMPTFGMFWTGRDAMGLLADYHLANSDNLRAGAIIPRLYMMERNGPAPETVTSWLIPRIMILIASMITIMYAANSLVRERTAGTLHLLLTPPGNFALSSLLGKVVFPAMLGFVCLVMMLLFAQTVIGYIIFPNWIGALGFQGAALLVISLQGLTISALARSEFAALIASTGYFILLMLFTNLFFNNSSDMSIARVFGLLTPVTFMLEPWTQWLSQGVGVHFFESNIIAVGAIGVVSLLAAIASVGRYRRNV